MKNLNYKILITGLLTLLFTITATAQNVYRLDEGNSQLSVSGTSTLGDWELEASDFSAETGLNLEDGSVSEIQYVNFTAPVSELESGKNAMDNKAHEALKEEEFPQIQFSLEGDTPQTVTGNNANITGMLTLAGETREITVPVDFNIVSGQQFTVSGEVRLKMSDFGIDQPTAFFGTLQTDDEVEVSYNLEFDRSN